MITAELIEMVRHELYSMYGITASPEYIRNYIAEMNENVDYPYGIADEDDAADIANCISVSWRYEE